MKNKIFLVKKYLNKFNKNNIFINFKERILWMFCALVIFRIGSLIPMNGINLSIIVNKLTIYNKSNILLNIYNLFSGGSLNRLSIFSIGIMPYISSSILIQLLTNIFPYFIKLKKNYNDYGKNILNLYMCFFILLFSILHSFLAVVSLNKILLVNKILNLNFYRLIYCMLSLISGTMFLIWLSEQITSYGIGNGISIIIFIGITSNILNNIKNIYFDIINKNIPIFLIIISILIIYLLIYISVFIELSQRKIIINYPKQYFFGKNFLRSTSTYLPIKINIPGVMPSIFTSSFIIFLNFILNCINNKINPKINYYILKFLYPENILYFILYIFLTFVFCYIYSPIIFNVKETSLNLKRSGAFIPNIRPGENTSKYIEDIMYKLIFIGSCYISFICLIPEFLKLYFKINTKINGSSLLIIVVVVIEIITQIQSIIVSTEYKSILKKINLD